MKNVLILSGSPRRQGNSDLLCDEFARGAAEAGNSVEKIFLRDKTVGDCNACNACGKTGECVIRDDMPPILEKMHWADVIVMASPVYFYSISGRMKTLIDRTYSQWTKLDNKEFYYIMTSLDDTPHVMDCALACFRGFAVCLKGAVEKGILQGKGVCNPGDVSNTPYMRQAYEMGKGV